MKSLLIIAGILLLAGCDEETRQAVRFSNCIDGAKGSPAYAEVVRACADVAIALREKSERAAAQNKGK
jgi:uncharacterized lipoprotein YajG